MADVALILEDGTHSQHQKNTNQESIVPTPVEGVVPIPRPRIAEGEAQLLNNATLQSIVGEYILVNAGEYLPNHHLPLECAIKVGKHS